VLPLKEGRAAETWEFAPPPPKQIICHFSMPFSFYVYFSHFFFSLFILHNVKDIFQPIEKAIMLKNWAKRNVDTLQCISEYVSVQGCKYVSVQGCKYLLCLYHWLKEKTDTSKWCYINARNNFWSHTLNTGLAIQGYRKRWTGFETAIT